MTRIALPLILSCLVAGIAAAEEPAPDAEIARLKSRIEKLEAEVVQLRKDLDRLRGMSASSPEIIVDKKQRDADVRRLTELLEKLRKDPRNVDLRDEAAEIAKRLARPFPTRQVWEALISTGALRDEISLAEAEKILGPPTEKTAKQVGWYHNPHGAHVAPSLRAQISQRGLVIWEFGLR